VSNSRKTIQGRANQKMEAKEYFRDERMGPHKKSIELQNKTTLKIV
jgi:hypothetical protein